MKALVSVVKCDSYDSLLVQKSVKESFDNIGGLEKYVKEGDKVFLKVNAVFAATPAQAITTHPEIVRAVIKEVKRVGGIPIVGDNPGIRNIEPTIKKNGTFKVCKEEDVEIAKMQSTVVIDNPNGKVFKHFDVSESIIDCDVLINLPKLKTHGLTYMTVAIKNLFGLIYGIEKAKWHMKAKDQLAFADMLTDLYGAIVSTFENKKILHLCDGVIGLEGDGPGTSGVPKKADVILCSDNAVALDRIALDIASLDYKKLLVVQEAVKRGYGPSDLSNINVIGEDVSLFKDIKFLEPKDFMESRSLLKVIQYQPVKNILMEYPVIEDVCIMCGKCAEICPPNALTFEKGNTPILEKNECIRCWCCQEMCPVAAIDKSKRPLLGRMLFRK